MKKTINFYDFERGFVEYNRRDKFSYEGLKLIFDYLDELEEDLGVELEYDPIAICGEFTEYGNVLEAMEEYSLQEEEGAAGMEALREHLPVVLEGESGIIVVGE